MNKHDAKCYKNVYIKFLVGARFVVDKLFTDKKKYQNKTTFRFKNQTNGINCLKLLPERIMKTATFLFKLKYYKLPTFNTKYFITTLFISSRFSFVAVVIHIYIF